MPSSYAIGARFEALMERLIESGRYNSKSEIIREGLRMVEDREDRLAALRGAIREGDESAADTPAEDVFDRLQAKYEARAHSSK